MGKAKEVGSEGREKEGKRKQRKQKSNVLGKNNRTIAQFL